MQSEGAQYYNDKEALITSSLQHIEILFFIISCGLFIYLFNSTLTAKVKLLCLRQSPHLRHFINLLMRNKIFSSHTLLFLQ